MQLVFYSIYVCVCMYCCSVTSASPALQVGSLLLSHQGNPYMYYSMCVYIYIYMYTHICIYVCVCIWGFSYSSVGKESACNAEDLHSVPGSGRCPGEGNVNSLQYSCLENLMDRGACRATVHRVTRVGHDLATKPPPSVQFSCSVVSDSFRPHEPQHARPPCLSPTPRVHPNPCSLTW